MHSRRNLVDREGKNQCPTCGEFFNSNGAFDLHRYGEYNARQCYTPSEMQSVMGMVYHNDWWVIRVATEADKAKMQSLRKGKEALREESLQFVRAMPNRLQNTALSAHLSTSITGGSNE